MYFSKSTNGFYDELIHGNNIPPDAIKIPEEEYRRIMDGQASGGSIAVDELGFPIVKGSRHRNIQDVISKKLQEIEQWRLEREFEEITFEHNGRVWDAGQQTRSRIEPVLQLNELPNGFFWTDADNVDVPVTKAELVSLYQAMIEAMVGKGFAIHQRQREMKQLVSLMKKVKDVDDFVIGW